MAGPATRVVDFYTNPTFDEVLQAISQQWEKENISLRACGRGESQGKFNHQTGVVDGIERARMLLMNLSQAALKPLEQEEPT